MRKKACSVVAMLVFAVPIAMAQAQQSGTPSKTEETIVTTTNLVTVNVVVVGRDGSYVRGLKREQFEVLDEKVKQQITHFAAGDTPVSLALVCEVHPSTPERLSAVLSALRQFTRSLRDNDSFFFTAFGKEGSVTPDFIPTAPQLVDHLSFVKPGGPASLYDAVYVAANRLRAAHTLKKAILIVSDGDDDSSSTSYNQLRNRLREFDVQIYSIGIANGRSRWMVEDITRQTGRRPFRLNADASMGRAVLAEMSRVSGGAAYFPEVENEPELVGIFTQIALELREQYTLGFYPSPTVTNKELRALKVRVHDQNSRSIVLSYRKSYRQNHPAR